MRTTGERQRMERLKRVPVPGMLGEMARGEAVQASGQVVVREVQSVEEVAGAPRRANASEPGEQRGSGTRQAMVAGGEAGGRVGSGATGEHPEGSMAGERPGREECLAHREREMLPHATAGRGQAEGMGTRGRGATRAEAGRDGRTGRRHGREKSEGGVWASVVSAVEPMEGRPTARGARHERGAQAAVREWPGRRADERLERDEGPARDRRREWRRARARAEAMVAAAEEQLRLDMARW